MPAGYGRKEVVRTETGWASADADGFGVAEKTAAPSVYEETGFGLGGADGLGFASADHLRAAWAAAAAYGYGERAVERDRFGLALVGADGFGVSFFEAGEPVIVIEKTGRGVIGEVGSHP